MSPTSPLIRLIAFPFAGGNQYSYKPIADRLGPEVTLECVELPGRGRRFGEPLRRDMYALAGALLGPALDLARRGPYAIFGHSMGAWLGYVMAHALLEHGAPPPRHLIVSGAGGPGRPSRHSRHTLPRADFVDALRDLGGCPEEFLQDSSLLELFLPVLYADFQIVETFAPKPAPAFDFPITALQGADDDVTREEAEAWSQETQAAFTSHECPGGHFFLFEQVDRVVEVIVRALALNRVAA